MAIFAEIPSSSTWKPLPRPPSSPYSQNHASIVARSMSPNLASILPSKTGLRSSRIPTVSSSPSQSSTLSSFTTLVTTSQTLSCLLSFLPWSDFVALSQICTTCRHIFLDENLRDIILTRYVDGYGYVLRQKDPSFLTGNTVPVTLHDLDLLLISQSTPLHLYPAHALSVLSSFLPTLSQHTTSQKLVQLAQAHSRFVLLIQSIAHSSSQPPPIESGPDPLAGLAYDARHMHARSSTSGSRLKQRPMRDEITSTTAMRELQFPAPLSYSRRSDDTSLHQPSDLYRATKSVVSEVRSSAPHSFIVPSTYQISRATVPSPSTVKKKSRLSVFGTGNRPFPQPSEPDALKYHSWRQTPRLHTHSRRSSSINRASVHASSEDSFFSYELGMNDLRKPTPWVAASRKYSSSDTSLGSGSSSVSGGTPSSAARSSDTSPPSGFASIQPKPLHPSLISTSPHDLILATSKVRAPILRVFVPCSQLSETFDIPGSAGSIERCEDQLVAVGLWEHLSTGDIVCNLGYVPESASSNGPSEDEGESLTQGSRRQRRNRDAETQKWLVFNGEVLVPFSPAEDRVPTRDPLSLPSPWYYEHIRSPLYPSLSSTSFELASSQMVLDRLPPFPSETPQMSLINYALNVKSPTSRDGVIRARRWVWVARMWRGGGMAASGLPGSFEQSDGPKLEMGIGWQGEWILECEGTKEGKQILLESIRGNGSQARQWGFVREYSGGGRIWLRMINTYNNDRIQRIIP